MLIVLCIKYPVRVCFAKDGRQVMLILIVVVMFIKKKYDSQFYL